MGVEEIRAGIAVATEKAQSSIAAITQASLELDEARGILMTACRDAGAADMAHSQGLLAEALQALAGIQSTIRASITSAEDHAARL